MEFTEKEKLEWILTNLHDSRERVRIFLGDPKTGDNWLEEYDVTGYIGKSCGSQPIWLLVNNSRSMGGPALLTERIMRIVGTKNHTVYYSHPNWKTPVVYAVDCTVYTQTDKTLTLHDVVQRPNADSIVWAKCETTAQAERLAAFLRGERMAK